MGNRTLPDYAVCICLDDKETITGTLHSTIFRDAIPFCGDIGFIRAVKEAFDRIGRPQPTALLRSFVGEEPEYSSFNAQPEHVRSQAAINALVGKEETMDLLMTSIRYAEWQGLILNRDGSVRGRFETMRQCLELISK